MTYPPTGYAPLRKRPKRLEKKMRKHAKLWLGYFPKYPIVLTPEQTEEFVRQLARTKG